MDNSAMASCEERACNVHQLPDVDWAVRAFEKIEIKDLYCMHLYALRFVKWTCIENRHPLAPFPTMSFLFQDQWPNFAVANFLWQGMAVYTATLAFLNKLLDKRFKHLSNFPVVAFKDVKKLAMLHGIWNMEHGVSSLQVLQFWGFGSQWHHVHHVGKSRSGLPAAVGPTCSNSYLVWILHVLNWGITSKS